MRNALRLVILIALIGYTYWAKQTPQGAPKTPLSRVPPSSEVKPAPLIGQNAPPPANGSADDGSAAIAQDFAQHRSNVRVQGSGTVVKVLRDDTEGLQHQKFLLRMRSGQTVLVAHDIDIAPRLDDLNEGDTVTFSGEYVWTEQGGVVHWTHHDPQGRHAAGWLGHNGKTYQ